MSWKKAIEYIDHCHYVLDAGGGVPAHIFMTQALIDQSEELLWQEVVTIKNFPGVTNVVVTPDAHASGNGIPVGVAVETDGSTIIPCAAGYDISCGMIALQTNLTAKDVADDRLVRAWINAVEDRIAVGAGTHRAPRQRHFNDSDIDEILMHGALALTNDKQILERLERTHLPVDSATFFVPERAKRGYKTMTSLGGGNHFTEADIEVDENGNYHPDSPVWMLIHTGSRGFGHGTAEYFFNQGAELMGLPKNDREKVWFGTESPIGRQYINQMNAAANYAIANRLTICQAVMEATGEIFGGSSELLYEISHNLCQDEGGRLIHRKGATRAFPAGHPALKGTRFESLGHPILVPGSMGTASAILYAEPGAEKSLYSINHGCGRVMSRRAAKDRLAFRLGLVDTEEEALFSIKEAQQLVDDEMRSMNILINTRQTPLDECLHAYKGIDEVLAAVEGAGLAKVAHKIRPRAVIKGTD